MRLLGFSFQRLLSPDDGGAGAGGGSPLVSGAGSGAGNSPPTAPASTTSGGSATASAPAVAVPSPSNGGVAPPDIFAGLSALDDDSPPAATPAVTVPTPVAPTPPAPAAVAQEQQVAQPVRQEAQQASGGVLPRDPGAVAAMFSQNRATLIDGLARAYQLSEQDVATLALDTPGVLAQYLPRALATVQLNAVQAAYQAMANLVPGMVQNTNKKTEQVSALNNRFATRWPNIKPEHYPALRTVATAYRTNNPKATLEQAIEDIGHITSTMLKLPTQPQLQVVGGIAAAGGGRPVPFTPTSGGATPSQSNSPVDRFAGLGMDFD